MTYPNTSGRSDLVHFGVKGMHWGHHKAQPVATHPDYHSGLQKRDREQFGRGAPERINKSMQDGLSRKDALSAERQRRSKKRQRQLALAGAAYLAVVIAQNTPKYAAVKINPNAESFLRNTMAISSTAHKLNYAKKGLRGAYKITTL